MFSAPSFSVLACLCCLSPSSAPRHRVWHLEEPRRLKMSPRSSKRTRTSLPPFTNAIAGRFRTGAMIHRPPTHLRKRRARRSMLPLFVRGHRAEVRSLRRRIGTAWLSRGRFGSAFLAWRSRPEVGTPSTSMLVFIDPEGRRDSRIEPANIPAPRSRQPLRSRSDRRW